MKPESTSRQLRYTLATASAVSAIALAMNLSPDEASAEESHSVAADQASMETFSSPNLLLASNEDAPEKPSFGVPQSGRHGNGNGGGNGNGNAGGNGGGNESPRGQGQQEQPQEQDSDPAEKPASFQIPSVSRSAPAQAPTAPAAFIPQIPRTRDGQPITPVPMPGGQHLPPVTPPQTQTPGQQPGEQPSSAPPEEPEDPEEPEQPAVVPTPAPSLEPAPAPLPPPEAAPAPPPPAFAHPCPSCDLNQHYIAGHGGIDMDQSIGAPLYAIADGDVLHAGPRDPTGFGQVVYLRLADGTIVKYGHIDRWDVQQGQKVVAGQQVATVGNKGSVRPGLGGDGSHLHLEIHENATGVNGTKVNPAQWLRDRGVQI
jgi:murein DD-endopeptidase MepM/ murein hydrolase activator NlpD